MHQRKGGVGADGAVKHFARKVCIPALGIQCSQIIQRLGRVRKLSHDRLIRSDGCIDFTTVGQRRCCRKTFTFALHC